MHFLVTPERTLVVPECTLLAPELDLRPLFSTQLPYKSPIFLAVRTKSRAPFDAEEGMQGSAEGPAGFCMGLHKDLVLADTELAAHGGCAWGAAYDRTSATPTCNVEHLPQRLRCGATLNAHTNWVETLQHDNEYMYSGSQDMSIRKWRRSDLHCEAVLKGHEKGVLSLKLLGDMLYAGDRKGEIKLWKVGPGEDQHTCKGTLSGHKGAIWMLQYDEEIGRLYSCCDDKKVISWDVQQLKQVKAFDGHKDKVYREVLYLEGRATPGAGPPGGATLRGTHLRLLREILHEHVLRRQADAAVREPRIDEATRGERSAPTDGADGARRRVDACARVDDATLLSESHIRAAIDHVARLEEHTRLVSTRAVGRCADD
mgnify:CR=1 FL=1